jgi:hypothetical protein
MTKPASVFAPEWARVGEGNLMEKSTDGSYVYTAIFGPDLTVRTRYPEMPGEKAITQVFRPHSSGDSSVITRSDHTDGATSVITFCVGDDDLSAKFFKVPYSDLELSAVQFVKQHLLFIYPRAKYKHIATLLSIESATRLTCSIGVSFMKHIKERKMSKPGNTVAAVVAVVEACRTGSPEPFHTERAGKYLGRAISACVEGLQHGERGKLLPESHAEVEALSRWMINYISVWYDSMDVDDKINMKKALIG